MQDLRRDHAEGHSAYTYFRNQAAVYGHSQWESVELDGPITVGSAQSKYPAEVRRMIVNVGPT